MEMRAPKMSPSACVHSRARMLVAALCLSTGIALAVPAAAAPRGVLYVTDRTVDTRAPNFEKTLRKENKAALTKNGSGVWEINYVAFLNKPAPGDNLNVVFYDVSNPKHEAANAFPIAVGAKAHIVAGKLSVSPEDNLQAGKTYNVLVTQLKNGKEIVFAKTKLELK